MGLKLYDVVVRVALMVLPIILGKVTPQIRDNMVEYIHALEKTARETENDYDDMLIYVIKVILQID